MADVNGDEVGQLRHTTTVSDEGTYVVKDGCAFFALAFSTELQSRNDAALHRGACHIGILFVTFLRECGGRE
jgi:hypothetical protein